MTSGFLRNKLPYLLVDLRVSGAKHFSHLLLVMLSWTSPRFQEPESNPSIRAQERAGGLSSGLSSPAV